MKYLSLYGNRITDIGPLSKLTSLVKLYLGNNQITDINLLGNLIQLECLSLRENQITDIGPLSELINVSELKLNGNQIREIRPLVDNVGIRDGDEVDISQNPLNYQAFALIDVLQEKKDVNVIFTRRAPMTLILVSGNNQRGEPNTPLPDPFMVQVMDQDGNPFAGVPVTFELTEGDGLLVSGNFEYQDQNRNGIWDANEPWRISEVPLYDGLDLTDFQGETVSAFTDLQGYAKANLTFGSTLGPAAGRNTVQVTAQDIRTTVSFMAIANAPPQANDDEYTVSEGERLEVDTASGVLRNDTDANGDELTAILVQGVSKGKLILNTDGSFQYTPHIDFLGEDFFTYKANDGFADSSAARVTITVTASGIREDFDGIDTSGGSVNIDVGETVSGLQTYEWGGFGGTIQVVEVSHIYPGFGNVLRLEPAAVRGAGIAMFYPPVVGSGIKLPGTVIRFFMFASELAGGVSLTDRPPGGDPELSKFLSFIVTKKQQKWVFTTDSNGVPGFGRNLEIPVQPRKWDHFEIGFEPTERRNTLYCRVFLNGKSVFEDWLDFGELNIEKIYVEFQSRRIEGSNSNILFNNIAVDDCTCKEGGELDTGSPSGTIAINDKYTNSPTVTVIMTAQDHPDASSPVVSGVEKVYIDGDVRDPNGYSYPWPACDRNNVNHTCESADSVVLRTYRLQIENLLSDGDGEKLIYAMFEDKGCNYSQVPGEDWVILDTRSPIAEIDNIEGAIRIGTSYEVIAGNSYDIMGIVYDDTYNIGTETSFDRYTLDYGKGTPTATYGWTTITTSTSATGAQSEFLGKWDTTGLSDNYTIRLRAWDKAGNTSPLTSPLTSVTATVNPRKRFPIEMEEGRNVISVPLNPGQSWRLKQLVERIQQNASNNEVVNRIQYYNHSKNGFDSFYPGIHQDNSPFNIEVRGGEGYIVYMNEDTTVTFEGGAWSNGNTTGSITSFRISLREGLNVIGVPLDPGESWRLRQLAEEIEQNAPNNAIVTQIKYYNHSKDGFDSFYPSIHPDNSPFNIQIRGGEGYLVYMSSDTTVTFSGGAWEQQ